MRVVPTAIEGLCHLHSSTFSDERGSFMVGWQLDSLAALPGWKPFVQESISTSRRGVLRGMHLQSPSAQGKLVRVIAGEIFDVAVDLRSGSPTSQQWSASTLRGDGTALWIPPGFAHGFLVRSENAVVLYQVTAPWKPEHELTVRWDDPTLNIDWPLDGPPLLSPPTPSAMVPPLALLVALPVLLARPSE